MSSRIHFMLWAAWGILFSCGGRFLQAEITDKHEAVVKEVADRLLAVMDQPDAWEVWPPTITVIDPGYANAMAGFRKVDGKDVPFIEVTVETIEAVANFDPEILAFTIGHELGHLYHDHGHKALEFYKQYGDKLAGLRLASNREQELEADLFGMKLALKAGYSRQGIKRDLRGWRKATVPYCRFEGLSLDHPPWEDRAAYLLQEDQQKALWESLSSFQTGVMFLENQHYAHAELCFRNVTNEFPECYEAWANLGYALLMQYCDALEPEDLRSLDVGHLVVGGFYRRPDSLEPLTRGPDEQMWYEAVGAFREALRLKDRLNIQDDFLMVKANLAVAYLVHPGGKDVGQAEQWFEQVFATLQDEEKSKNLEPLVHASILINAGTARGLDENLVKQTLALLAQAKTTRGNGPAVAAMESALRFNQAQAMATQGSRDDSTNALKLYEEYLDGMTSASSWWPIAYEQYVQLAKAAGETPKEKSDFRKPGIKDWRAITAVPLANGETIGLSESIEQVIEALGPADADIPVIEGSNLKYYQYKELGLKILATREVLAIILEKSAASSITIRRPGLGGEEAHLTLGMPRAELEALLGGDWDVELAHLFDVDTLHQLYREVGLAVRFDDGVVSEMVVSVVPIK